MNALPVSKSKLKAHGFLRPAKIISGLPFILIYGFFSGDLYFLFSALFKVNGSILNIFPCND